MGRRWRRLLLLGFRCRVQSPNAPRHDLEEAARRAQAASVGVLAAGSAGAAGLAAGVAGLAAAGVSSAGGPAHSISSSRRETANGCADIRCMTLRDAPEIPRRSASACGARLAMSIW